MTTTPQPFPPHSTDPMRDAAAELGIDIPPRRFADLTPPTLHWVKVEAGRYAASTGKHAVMVEYIPDFPADQRWQLYTLDKYGAWWGDWDCYPTKRDAQDMADTLFAQGDLDDER